MNAAESKSAPNMAVEKRLALALLISLLLHLGGYGAYKAVKKYHLDKIAAPEWLKQVNLAKLLPTPKPPEPKKPEELKLSPPKPKPPEPQEIPLNFIEVDPLLAEKEPPKEAKYYSALNSKASNPETGLDLKQPKMDGKQDKVPKTMDTLKPAPPPKPQPVEPPQPPAPVVKKQEEIKAEAPKPKGGQAPGDLAMAKPVAKPAQDLGKSEDKKGQKEVPEQPQKLSRPRTVAEALQRLDPSLAGEKMKQEGGVRNQRIERAVDAMASPFGAYDNAIIAAIQSRWFQLIDQQKGSGPAGKVVVSFRLHFDGRVTDMSMIENEVGELFGTLCMMAIKDPSPYARWPSDLRRLVNADYREVTFTFYYSY